MILQILFDVPMSLTDRQFILPSDMMKWGEELGLSLKWRTFRHSLAHGENMFFDMKKRLNNALRDAGMDNSRVENLLEWFKKISEYQKDEFFNGATALYHFIKKSNHEN